MAVRGYSFFSPSGHAICLFCEHWQKTGAKLFIFPECCPMSTERVVQVMGKPVNVANTVGTVLDLILPVRCHVLYKLHESCFHLCCTVNRVVLLDTVSEKNCYCILPYDFIKYWLILKILSPQVSAINVKYVVKLLLKFILHYTCHCEIFAKFLTNIC